ncbi:MAG: hypothetical protein EOM40_07540 [Clostridia bacterium]|nr:hypothetical protein [Clostridia bacterium]
MKATGIVRRIDDCVIIGQTVGSLENKGVFADFVQKFRLKIQANGNNRKEIVRYSCLTVDIFGNALGIRRYEHEARSFGL